MNKIFFVLGLSFLVQPIDLLAQDLSVEQSSAINLLSTKDVPAGLVPGSYALSSLVFHPRVVDELNLTEQQRQKLERTVENERGEISRYRSEMEIKMQEAKKSGDLAARNELEEIRRNRTEEMHQTVDRELSRKILNVEQSKRLEQIRLQAEGPAAFRRKEVREALGLSEEQIHQINKIIVGGARNMRSAAFLPEGIKQPKISQNVKSDLSTDPEKKEYDLATSTTLSKMSRTRVETMRSIENVLINAQRVKFQKMVGPPINFLIDKSDKK